MRLRISFLLIFGVVIFLFILSCVPPNGERTAVAGLAISKGCYDADNDGYGRSGRAISTCSGSTRLFDCNDNNREINPRAREICGNRIDDNCNKRIDEAGCVARIVPGSTPPSCSPTTEICDGLDNDCDSQIDEDCDDDGDDYCDSTMTTVGTPAVCPHGGGDCGDNLGPNPDAGEIHEYRNRNPGSPEGCNPGGAIDDDCDGLIDEDVTCIATCNPSSGPHQFRLEYYTQELVGSYDPWRTVGMASDFCEWNRLIIRNCVVGSTFYSPGSSLYTGTIMNRVTAGDCNDIVGLGSRCFDPDIGGGYEPAYCTPSTCGNNLLDPGELCDDGNTINGDGCTQCRCSDTDGGRLPRRPGTVTTADGTFRDVCSSEVGHELGYITERSCADDGSVQSEDLLCNYGMAADDPYRNEFGTGCETDSYAAGCVIVG